MEYKRFSGIDVTGKFISNFDPGIITSEGEPNFPTFRQFILRDLPKKGRI